MRTIYNIYAGRSPATINRVYRLSLKYLILAFEMRNCLINNHDVYSNVLALLSREFIIIT